MEDDAVARSLRRAPAVVALSAGLLGLALFGGAPSDAQAAPPVGISPFRTALASQADAAATPAKATGLPPLPLFAQAAPPSSSPAADPAAPVGDAPAVPFATPPPGALDGEDEDDGNDKQKDTKQQKVAECDNDSQCPAQSVCARHVCKSVARMTSGIVYFHQPGPIGFRLVLPFYYSFWRPQRSTRVVAPFVVDRQDHTEKTRDTWVFPTYQYRRTPTEKTHRLWPLFFYSDYGKGEGGGRAVGIMPFFYTQKRGTTETTLIPPLLFFEHKDHATGSSDTVFLPALMFYRQRPKTSLALFLGLGYYYREAKSDDNPEEKIRGGYFPLVWYRRTGPVSTTSVLPLFFSGNNSETGARYSTLIPLFFYRRWEDKSHLFVSPLGGQYHDGPAGETTTLWLAPLTLRRETPASEVTVVPPVAAWWRNKQTGHSAGYAGLYFFSRDDNGRSEGLLPLFLRFENDVARAATYVVPPLLAAFHRSPQLGMGFVGPAYGWSKPATATAPAAVGGGLLPLFSFATGNKPHFLFVPPVVMYFADRAAGRYHFNFGPVFYRYTTKGPEAGYDAGLFPLLFVSRHGARRTQALLPLFYHHSEPGFERLVLGPLYWQRRCPQFFGDPQAAVHGGVVPVFFWKRSAAQSYTVLMPLFAEWRSKTGNVETSSWLAGPMFYHQVRRPAAPGSLPTLPGSATTGSPDPNAATGPATVTSTTFGILPLLYTHRSPERTLVVGPGFGYSRTAERRTLLIGPYVETVGQPGKPDQSISRVLFPLYYFHCSPGRRALVLFPLYADIRDENTSFRSVLWLYYGIKQGETSSHAVLPLFYAARGPGRSTTVLLPFFHHRNDSKGELAVGVLPLFGYGRDVSQSLLATPLGFYHHDYIKDRVRSAFLTFYADVERTRSDFGVFPLFFATRRGTARATFVLPFFYDSRDPTTDRSFTLLGPLFFGHKERATYGGFVPLVYGRNDGDGGFSMGIFPLVYASHKPLSSTWVVTPLFGFNTAATGFRFYLGPLYVRRDSYQKTFALFPLIYDGLDVNKQDRTTFVLPLFYRASSPERSLTMVTPLFWQYRTLASRTTLLAPLFIDVNNYYRSRTTAVGAVLPFIVRHRDDLQDSTTWLVPPLLTYFKRAALPGTTAQSVSFVQFPLLWHFKQPDRQTTVLFPLVYYLKRPATTTVVALPFFGYRRDEHNNRSLLLLPLLTWIRNGGDGSRDRVVFPFFWHFSSKETGRATTVLFPLFLNVRRPNLALTVFFPLGAHWRTDRGHSTIVLNTYVHKGTGEYAGAWSVHFWPLFNFGRPRPQDLEWSVLYGLVGYSREGIHRTLRLLWGIVVPLEPVGTQSAWYGATLRMASE